MMRVLMHGGVLLLAMGAAALPVAAGPIADLLAAAQPGDVIELEAGSYSETGIAVPDGVTLRAADEAAGLVILGSQGGQSILLFDGAGSGTVIEGLGFAGLDGLPLGPTARGGAVYCTDASPVFRDCEFLGLSAGYGGAVYGRDGSSPSFNRCQFTGNGAQAAGGAAAFAVDCLPVFDHCLFEENYSNGSGGTISAAMGSRPTLQSCTIFESTSAVGGALAGWDNADAQVEGTIMTAGLSGRAWAGDASSLPDFHCSDLFGNAGGDWVGPLASQEGTDGNISADPVFCFGAGEGLRFGLDGNSPCAARANAACGTIGAFPVTCWGGSPVPEESLPAVSRLVGNYPNPFNPHTTIRYDVRQAGRVTVSVFDLKGRRVRRLVDSTLPAGSYDTVWRGDNARGRPAAAGVYFLRLKTADGTDVKRATLIK